MIIVLRRLHGNFGYGMFHLAILRHLGCTFARPRSAQSSNAVTYIDVVFTYPFVHPNICQDLSKTLERS